MSNEKLIIILVAIIIILIAIVYLGRAILEYEKNNRQAAFICATVGIMCIVIAIEYIYRISTIY